MTSQPTATKPLQPSWSGRSHVTSFIRCLHLLDLPLLPDWPGISEQTFSKKFAQQNLQTRVKAIEWSLYRLFELYNSNETKDKLRPFFPPTAPLQSLNLRAALYRCLTELKKNGILGKEILLRKTMLDDCKGEKFEEMVAFFAMMVLKKVVSEKEDAHAQLDSAKLTNNQLLPVILALRKSLQLNLDTRRQLKLDHKKIMTEMNETKQDLQQRMVEIESCTLKPDRSLDEELNSLINTNWIGDRAWAEILLHGLPVKSTIIPVSSFDLVKSISVDDQSKSRERVNVVEEMNTRIHTHKTRLAKWEGISNDTATRRAASQPITSSRLEVKPTTRAKRFSKHQDLHLSNRDLEPVASSTIAPQYQNVLNVMRRELSRTGPKKPMGAHGQDGVEPASKQISRSDIAVRTISDSPNIESSVELKPRSLREILPAHESYIDESDHIEGESQDQSQLNIIDANETSTNSEKKSINDMDLQLQNLGLDVSKSALSPMSSVVDENDSSIWIPETKIISGTPQIPVSQLPENQHLVTSGESDDEVDELPNLPSSPTKEWMSLTDRTRASMSKSGNYRNALDSDPLESTTEQDSSHINDADENSPIARTPPLSASTIDSRQTLLERTRQSMSSLANSSNIKPRNRKTQAINRSSQLFPINQFETPRSGKTYSPDIGSFANDNRIELDSRASTPRDKLFEAEAEYTSVFKSRPKVALDPGLSTDMSLLSASESFTSENAGSDNSINGARQANSVSIKQGRLNTTTSSRHHLDVEVPDTISSPLGHDNEDDLMKDIAKVEGDYASVFKSRPKIATSPGLSPDRSNLKVNKKKYQLGNSDDITKRNDEFDAEADYDSVFKSRPKVAISADWSSEMRLLSSNPS